MNHSVALTSFIVALQMLASPAAVAEKRAGLADFSLTEGECKARDGLWANGGGIPRPGETLFCNLPSPNAGKACASSGECAGSPCLASRESNPAAGTRPGRVGTCGKYGRVGGCIALVENGVAKPIVCYD